MVQLTVVRNYNSRFLGKKSDEFEWGTTITGDAIFQMLKDLEESRELETAFLRASTPISLEDADFESMSKEEVELIYVTDDDGENEL